MLLGEESLNNGVELGLFSLSLLLSEELLEHDIGAIAPGSALNSFGEALSDDPGEDQRGLSVNLDRIASGLDLTPRDGLIGSSTRVTGIVVETGVDVYGVVETVSHHVCVKAVMLGGGTSDNDSTSASALDGDVINEDNVLRDVDDETGSLVVMEVEHVTDGAISDTRAEHRDVVLVAPVVNGVLVVDLLTESSDDLGGVQTTPSLSCSSCIASMMGAIHSSNMA